VGVAPGGAAGTAIANMRRTKIIATVGPSSDSPDVLHALIAAGVDVFRLNFSHGTHDSHAANIRAIRDVARAAGKHVAIMQDLSGPKMRTGPVPDGRPVQLEAGTRVLLVAGSAASSPTHIFTPYAELTRSAQAGDRLLLDDGRIELRVIERRPDGLETEVVHGGPLGSNKGINAPGVPLPPSALTEKDAGDLRFGLAQGVDLVALSFVQTAEDVSRAREIIDRAGAATPLIAKIERPAGVRNLREIMALTQGVMVARGDLGNELPLEQVPRVQKEIIRTARAFGQPAIVATQVLESMRMEPRPTRAEVSDAANAVDEGADAIMLAGETAAGVFPVRAVQMLDAIIRDAEPIAAFPHVLPAIDPTVSLHGPALCEAAVTLATTARAAAIVAVTHEGRTARLLSALRPPAPILAATPNLELAASLSLWWGVEPFVSVEANLDRLEAAILDRALLAPGSVVVFINVSPAHHRTDANFLHVRRVAG
jgi:pyruvate kinase